MYDRDVTMAVPEGRFSGLPFWIARPRFFGGPKTGLLSVSADPQNVLGPKNGGSDVRAA